MSALTGHRIVMATLTTDEDGFYMFHFEHKGTRKAFTIEIMMGDKTQSQQALLDADKYVVVNFEVSG
jgi:hypothetical protein